jgi:tRNA(fMet)-specific endonuclease VapC
MFILDTDHISILDRSGPTAQPLLAKLARVNPNQVATTIITYEEQMRGWLSYTAKTSIIAEQIAAYQKLERHIQR